MEAKPLPCPMEAGMREYQKRHGVNEYRDEAGKNIVAPGAASDLISIPGVYYIALESNVDSRPLYIHCKSACYKKGILLECFLVF